MSMKSVFNIVIERATLVTPLHMWSQLSLLRSGIPITHVAIFTCREATQCHFWPPSPPRGIVALFEQRGLEQSCEKIIDLDLFVI